MTKGLSEYLLYQTLCQEKRLDVSKCSADDINSLKAKGLDIEHIKDHYELQQSIKPLLGSEINKYLQSAIISRISQLSIQYKVNSTNTAIHEYPFEQGYLILIAEHQQAGKGRKIKRWASPLGSNLYLSIKFKFPASSPVHFMPLVTAVAVCNALSRLDIKGTMIKWPNDIYVNGKKIAGILVENRYNSVTANSCVVGIGLNVNMYKNSLIEQAWTSMALERNQIFDRNHVTALILSELIFQFDKLHDFNFKQFQQKWNKFDYLKGKIIKVVADQSEYEALAMGLAEDGSLQIIVCDKIKRIYSAEVSVAARDSF